MAIIRNREYNFSKTITALKTPLIFIVVYSHIHNVYSDINAFTRIITVITKAIIPTFFLISGYFLIKGANSYTLSLYIKKLYSRFKTLFIPYILWNIFPLLLPILLCIVTSVFKCNYERVIELINGMVDNGAFNPFNVFWDKGQSYPANFPMWYIRDLIVIICISPLLFYLIKYLRFISLFILVIPLYFKLTFSNAIFFVSLGMYLSMIKVDYIYWAQKNRLIILSLFTILFLLVYCNINIGIYFFECLYLVIGPFALFTLIYLSPDKLYRLFYNLSKYSFFVYAIHATYIYRIDKFVFKYTPNNLVSHLISYILVGLIVCYIAIVIYKLINKISPKALSILCGNRM